MNVVAKDVETAVRISCGSAVEMARETREGRCRDPRLYILETPPTEFPGSVIGFLGISPLARAEHTTHNGRYYEREYSMRSSWRVGSRGAKLQVWSIGRGTPRRAAIPRCPSDQSGANERVGGMNQKEGVSLTRLMYGSFQHTHAKSGPSLLNTHTHTAPNTGSRAHSQGKGKGKMKQKALETVTANTTTWSPPLVTTTSLLRLPIERAGPVLALLQEQRQRLR